jgi:hypothetical protein
LDIFFQNGDQVWAVPERERERLDNWYFCDEVDELYQQLFNQNFVEGSIK